MEPFTAENEYFDSTMFQDQDVEHTQSWLTVNPFKGCSLKCAYCFRVNWVPEDQPQLVIDVDNAIEKLIAHTEFIPHKTPISINISSTDCLLPKVRNSTFRALEILESKKLTNPFGITTKLGFQASEIDFLTSLKYIKPIVFISLAMIPPNIEPVPVKPRIKNLKMLSNTNIPTVLYFRPIVKGWNDSEEIISNLLLLGNNYADAICIGSLRLSPLINKNLTILNEDFENTNIDFHSKNIETELEKRILSLYEKLDIKKPLFKHTSCAVSYFLKIKNYNLLFDNPKKNCLSSCPATQQNTCNSKNQ